MSVALAVEDAVAVVYGVILFISPSNYRRAAMYTYTDCSSTQVVKCTSTVLYMVGRNPKSYEIGVSRVCTRSSLLLPLLHDETGAH